MKRSKISWADYSGGDLGIVTGCTPVSEGCRFCYGKAIYDRFGRDFSKVTYHPDKLARLQTKVFPPYSPKRGEPHMPMCFVCSVSDLFHPEVPEDFIVQAIDIMAKRTDVIWLILTKRADVLYGFTEAHMLWLDDISHIWFGVSGENQKLLSDRWSWLDNASVKTRWISVEPMLGPITLGDGTPDWVVCGAESGPNRRPFDKVWAIDLKNQCDERGIPFFFKQASGLYPGTDPTLEGREWKAWPR